ncbi:MAG: hypothetical protein M5U29_03125 [Anaerolineae bacterium]|nr:hypothetical protein [Anaerolineae bacterium]
MDIAARGINKIAGMTAGPDLAGDSGAHRDQAAPEAGPGSVRQQAEDVPDGCEITNGCCFSGDPACYGWLLPVAAILKPSRRTIAAGAMSLSSHQRI